MYILRKLKRGGASLRWLGKGNEPSKNLRALFIFLHYMEMNHGSE